MNEERTNVGLVVWLVASYLLYWPALWLAHTAGVAYGPPADWGDPQSWVIMWIMAPFMTWILLFAAAVYVSQPFIAWLSDVLVPW